MAAWTRSSSSSSSSSTRPSHDDDNDDSSGDDTSSSTPEEPEDNRKPVEVDGETYYIVTNEDGTKTYEVSGPKGLQAWAQNSGSDCVLTGDITLTSGSWSPVQDFSGKFDGQGHTISGLTSALFDTVSGGTVKNVALEVQIMGNQRGAGGVVRNYNSGTIMNCTVSGNISNNGAYAGGIVAMNSIGGSIIGCIVDGNVKASGEADINGIKSGQAGGIVASNSRGSIVGCCYTGESVQAEGRAISVGGIAGSNSTFADIISCYWSNPDEGVGNNDSDTAVTGERVTGDWAEAIGKMNALLGGCEYVFALDETTQKPVLVERNSAEQAVNRLLGHFWG